MSFTDHKITQFQHKVSDLADQPTLPPDELKARFDSSPEELRQAHNALCDDTAALDNKVDSIITETFDGVIEKSMFSDALTEEFDAKADEAALAAAVDTLEAADAAESAAREAADTAETAAREAADASLAETIAQKCEVYFGTYTGDGQETQTIELGFKPKALIVSIRSGNNQGRITESGAQIAFAEQATSMVQITESGFTVSGEGNLSLNSTLSQYNPFRFIAFK